MISRARFAEFLGRRLYEERTKRNLSVNQLCNALSASKQYMFLNPKTYYRYEAGKSLIPIDVLQAIVELYDMNIQEFFNV